VGLSAVGSWEEKAPARCFRFAKVAEMAGEGEEARKEREEKASDEVETRIGAGLGGSKSSPSLKHNKKRNGKNVVLSSGLLPGLDFIDKSTEREYGDEEQRRELEKVMKNVERLEKSAMVPKATRKRKDSVHSGLMRPLPFTQSVKDLPELENAEDAIAFFARHRADETGSELTSGKFTAPLKFVTLNRAPRMARHLPYDLVVVKPSQVNLAEYFVMTATSVMQFGDCLSGKGRPSPEERQIHQRELAGLPRRLAKAVPTDVVPMSQWIHETTCFRAVGNLGTFRYFRERKTMHKWRAAVRYVRFCRVRKEVGAKLVHLKLHFSKVVQTALKEIQGLVEQPAFVLGSRRAWTVEQFSKKQVENLEGNLQTAMMKAGAAIGKAMHDAVHDSRRDLKKFREELQQSKNIVNNANKSMAHMREDQEAMTKRISQTETDLKSIPQACRMVNFLALGRLLSYLVETYENLQEFVSDTETAGIFKVIIDLHLRDNQSVHHFIDPSEEAMFGAFTEFCTKLLEALDAFPLLRIPDRVSDVSKVPSYDPDHVKASEMNRMNEMTSLTAVCADNYALNRTFERLYGVVKCSYAKGNSFARGFAQRYEMMFRSLKTFKEDEYLKQNHEFTSLKADLSQFRDWEKDIANMKLETKCGTLMVIETRTFKDELLELLSRPRDAAKSALEYLGREEAIALIEEYRKAHTKLEIDDEATLTSHSDFVDHLNSQIVAQKFHVRRFELIHDLYSLMKEFQVKYQIEDATRLEQVAEERFQFEEALARGRNHVAASNHTFVEKLQAGIKTMEESCEQVFLQLSRAPFNDASEDAADIVALLEKIRSKWESQFAKAKVFAKQTELLVGRQQKPGDRSSATYNYEVGPVEVARSVLERRESIWQSRKRWNEDQLKWWTTDMRILLNPEKNDDGLDALKLEKLIDEYFQEAVTFNRRYKGDEVAEALLAEIRDVRSKSDFFTLFGHPSLLDRHFAEMYTEIFQVDFTDSEGNLHLKSKEAPQVGEDENHEQTQITIASMVPLGIFEEKNREPLEEICGTASKEFSLLKAMDKMEEDWDNLEFAVLEYKDTGTFIFRAMDEIEQVLDDQMVRTQAMRSSRYIKNMEERCILWEEQLKELESILSNRLAMQGTWLYLEPIFSSADICKQMPSEAKMFKKVDNLWHTSMDKTVENASVMAVFDQKGLLSKLEKANEMLDEIQKGLADYLNTKRVFFPRFFFLSNDELLEILSETKDPKRVQPHLIKCFEGIAGLEFTNTMDIKSMISAEGEVVPFAYDDVKEKVINPNEAGGCVEIWLDQIQNIMRKTVAHAFDLAIADYSKRERTAWLQEWPGQIVLGVSQTYWTQECTTAISEGPTAIQLYADKLTAQINDIIQLVRGKIPKLVRKTVSPLVVLDVHARDVTEELAKLGISNTNDFDWLCQLRYYWKDGRQSALAGEPGSISCKMINAERLYGYEYLGNSMRLVVTPLTDRCYRTLMGAVHLDYGGAPAGPAGTGKTETTKDLGKAIAIQCVVYNCSDSLDYKAMGKFFKGLAGTGAWACFDEFNRINLEVLSVVAQQILTIMRAKAAHLEVFEFEGVMIKLRRTCAPFITMNPGYAGRQELPDNLKALFRDVAMMVPDYAMIGQIILYSMGYLEGFKLAKKIVMTYKLCSEQLSNQSHYDYGMRAVMAVLRAAGNLKQQHPEEDENILCLRSIIDVNLPKFLAPDVPLFYGIVSDLFPGVKLPDVDYSLMDTTVREVCEEWKLDPNEYFLTKVHEIYEMMIVRHGFMVVGLPFSGKTTSLKMLQKVLSLLHERHPNDTKWTKVHTAVVNPKSITMGQLYGEFDAVSHEWTDGVLAIAYRNFSTNPPKIGAPEDRKWVWFDGPVDAIWIENMNTVLDDNKKLCLMNGEMIMMSPTMSMIFEPMDLEVASPATVSRVGVIYMEPFRVGWRPIYISWALRFRCTDVEKEGSSPFLLDESQTHFLRNLFDWLIDPCICFVRKRCHSFVEALDQTLVQSLLRLMEAMFLEASASDIEIDEVMIEGTFLFSLIWSIGGIVDAEGQQSFSDFLRRFMRDFSIVVEENDLKEVHTMLMLRNWRSPFEGKKYIFSKEIPEEGLVFDFIFTGAGGEYSGINRPPRTWMKWVNTFAIPELDPTSEFSSFVIPTKITAQMERVLLLNVKNGFPILTVGPTGTGKSMFTGNLLNTMLEQTTTKVVSIAFTAKTSANQTQQIVDLGLDKRRRGVFGPPLGVKCIVFVDDLNMPEVENYGAQPPIEILRQLVDNGGWYDLAEKTFREIVDTQLVGAMCPPGGSRNHITPRMIRHFSILCVSSFSGETMSCIFENILSWHMKAHEMPCEVIELAPKIVDATLRLYRSAIKNLLPTPTKSHYTFNLRDFSRIIQGVMMVPSSDSFDAKSCKRLWVHETCRVIMDRLIDHTDQEWFISAVETELKENLDEPNGLGDIAGHLPGNTSLEISREILFGNFSNPDNPKRPYTEIKDSQQLIPVMQDYLEMYNSESKKPMDLVMFAFAIEHVSRISRVLAMPRGNLLLVGVGGSGRQSLTRLAAFVADYSLIQVELTKNYTELEWREDLQKVLKGAGTGTRPMVFLFCDTQIAYESFIEDINCILNTGEVPNLFPLDARMDVLDKMQKIAKEKGIKEASPNDLWRIFIDRVRSRLHLVLAFSPIGAAFRDRLRKFPSLVNCCTIDWYFAWPKDALIAVARSFLGNIKLEDGIRNEIVDICQYMHVSVSDLSTRMLNELRRINYVTPTSYLELIRSFKDSFSSCREVVNTRRMRYQVGLEKLAFAAEQVGTMQQELTDLIPVLEKSKKETNALMAVIEEKLPAVEAMKHTVSEEAAIVQKQADECALMKAECESDLVEAIPMLEAAMQALDTLKPGDITEVKAMKSPPSGVVLVMSAVCQIMGVKPDRVKHPNDPTKKIDDYWGPSKKFLLGDPKFLQSLKDYDKDNMSPKLIETLKVKYISNPDFEESKIKQASVAAYGLCKWVGAMVAYDKVARVVGPKKEKLAETEETLKKTMETLDEKKAELKAVVDDLSQLENQLAEAKSKKAKLESDVDLCEKKLVRARQLIDGLGGEKSRWTQNIEDLKEEFVLLTGNVLISAGIIAYLGAFTAEYRDRVIEQWTALCRQKQIPCKEDPSLFQTLGDPVTVRAWNVNGLPLDTFSVDNAIILFNSRRWPLVIDPQGQANKWFRSMEAENDLKVIKLSDSNYMRTVENAVQFGTPVLLENIGEEIDPSFEPLLQKSTFRQGGVLCIRLGDAVVEYSDTFRLYITTKLRNPHYLPEIAVKVTLLNFMITPAGLQDQMLAKVVKAEQPELAAEKEKLIVDGAENAAKLKECEDDILLILSSSSGNILEDESAIETLKSSKALSDDIKEKQAIAVETEKKIDYVRAGYVPVAFHAQILYFCIADLANIEPTYQYSLEWFGSLFLRGIDESEPSSDLNERLQILNDYFTYSLYKNVCRSLLEKDKLLFSLLLCTRIMGGRNAIDMEEWRFFLTGGVATENLHENPCKEWLMENSWGEICRLAELPAFSGLREDFACFEAKFKEIYDSADAHQVPLPARWGEQLNNFQRMCILRCLRADKISLAVQDFVIEKMGDRFVKPPSFNLRTCYEDASYLTPLVFVLSSGSDPMAAIVKLSEEVNARVESISLGQGQGIKAESMIKKAQAAENQKIWVVLQNCHLAVSWMSALERIIENTSEANCNRQYRLWCTTYPTEDFPVAILQNSVKMTMEPPRGLRANLLSSYFQDPICQEGFLESFSRGRERKKLLFSLCFFHALVQERCKFGALGFNIPYEFSNSDRRISVEQLQEFLDIYDDMPWKALNYCTGHCNYGGRVTDDKDRRCLMAILKQFYNEDVLIDGHALAGSGSYQLPPDMDYSSYLAFIETLPLADSPEIFGLHENASITKGINETQSLFDALLLCQKVETVSRDNVGENGSEEEKMEDLKVVSDEDKIFEIAERILQRMPETYNMELAELKYPVKWEQSMNTVLCQELSRFNNLIKCIVASLDEVMKGVRGLVVMSEELEKVATSLLLGSVPTKWLAASYPSLKPLVGYVSDLFARLKFFQDWLDFQDALPPPTFWISGFYFTQAFLTGTLQNYARKYTIPIDEVDFDFVILDKSHGDIKDPPRDGAIIHGLFLDGARFDFENMCLAESEPKVLIAHAPTIHLLPRRKKDICKNHSYECPVYKTADRRGVLSTTGLSNNFVMMIQMPIAEDATQSQYIVGGVALLTATNFKIHSANKRCFAI